MFSLFSHFKNNEKQTATAGFGLIELMVSISIMAIIMAVVITRHERFNGAVLLRSEAYEIALQLREVQLSAVSATNRGGTEYRTNLGVHIDTDNRNVYKVFEDRDGDFFYDANEEIGQQGSIDPRFEIRAIRPVGDVLSGSGVSIVFQRPNFDARFFDNLGRINASQIEIDIARVGSTAAEDIRTIEITMTGQIAVR